MGVLLLMTTCLVDECRNLVPNSFKAEQMPSDVFMVCITMLAFMRFTIFVMMFTLKLSKR